LALADHELGQVYKALIASGLTEELLALRLGLKVIHVRHVLAGGRVSTYKALSRIADRLGIPRGLIGLEYVGPQPRAHEPSSGATSCARCDGPAFDVYMWTRDEIVALKTALRFTLREMSEYVGVTSRMISKWTSPADPAVPRPLNQAKLDNAWSRAPETAKKLFREALMRESHNQPRS
jgi:transcriptional regulator with XRE-family HTH domain